MTRPHDPPCVCAACQAATAPSSTVAPVTTEALLAERGKTHGDFRDHAHVTQELKRVMYAARIGQRQQSAVQREAVDMILHKLGRIVAGDPNFVDHWDDIAGYAKLVSQDLQRSNPPCR